MSQVPGQGDVPQVDETQIFDQPPRARQGTPRYDAPRRHLPERRLTREGYAPSTDETVSPYGASGGNAYGQGGARPTVAPRVAPAPRPCTTPVQSPRYAPDAMPRGGYYENDNPYDRAARRRAPGGTLLRIAAILARVMAYLLVIIVVILALPSLGVRQYALLPAAFLSRLLPPTLSGFLLLDMPFGGVFRTDLAVAATVLLVIDWLFTNLRLSR